jgi:hypothetical protein
MVKKSFDAPEETRSLHKGKIEVVDLGGVKVKRVIHERPGYSVRQTAKLSRPDGRARELKTPTPRSGRKSGSTTPCAAVPPLALPRRRES